MLRNYLLTSLRHLFRNKVFTSINILGLALGMACCFLIIRYLSHEFSYDIFHEKLDRIYRVNYHAGFGNTDVNLASIPPPIRPLLKDYFPEIEHSARMFGRSISTSIKGNSGQVLEKYEIEDFYFADSTILDIFSFDFIKGNPQTALDAPYSVVITEEMAEQFFGTTEALGKSIHFLDVYPFEVTGVVKAFPENSHIEFNMLVPYQNMFDIAPDDSRENMRNNLNSNWVISHSHTYVLLKDGQSAGKVNEGLRAFIDTYGNEQVREKQTFSLVPLSSIHLYSEASLEPKPPANMDYLMIFLAIGILTLIIACINFINFSTAGSLTRAKEVGVRKVLGAGKQTIIGQFIGESILLSFIAFLLALGFVKLFLPYVNELTGREMDLSLTADWKLVLLFFSIFPIVGFLAGSYPAFFVTRFKPVSVLKGKGYSTVPKGSVLRKVLITVQFIASIVLIAGAFGIFRQLQMLRNQPLGFQQDYIINVPLFSPSINSIFGGVDGPLRQKMNSFEEELLTNPNIEAVTLSSGPLGFGGVRRNVSTDEISPEDNLFLAGISVDYDFLDTYELELVTGRTFDRSFGTDHQNAYIINESAVELLKWETPENALDKAINREGKTGKVVGVMKDFHYASLRNEIDAFIMDVSAATFTDFSIKVKAGEMQQTIDFIESKWDAFFPQKVFEYTFLDDSINDLYEQEGRLGKIIGYFAFLAILISCFGLYGLVAYAAVQKTKEIGIRKVMGASIPNILSLLSKDFIFLILLAGFFAIPITYYGLSTWLEDYPIRVGISWWQFALPMMIVIGIALVTISYRTISAATRNPIEALRYE